MLHLHTPGGLPVTLKDFQNVGSHHADGLELYLTYIAETRYGQQYHFSLKQGTAGLLSNEDQRRRKRKALLKAFADTLRVSNDAHLELKRSEIYLSIANALNRLSHNENNINKCRIILLSDLKQHSSWFSVYRPKDLTLLKNNPEAVVELFESQSDIPNDLSGITLHIIYKPTVEDDAVFTALVNIYRKLLEPKGMQIHVGHAHQIIKQ